MTISHLAMTFGWAAAASTPPYYLVPPRFALTCTHAVCVLFWFRLRIHGCGPLDQRHLHRRRIRRFMCA